MSVKTFKHKYNKYYFRDVIRLWVHSQLGLKNNNYYSLHWFFEYSIKEDTKTLSKALDEIERPEKVIDRIKRYYNQLHKKIKNFIESLKTTDDEY